MMYLKDGQESTQLLLKQLLSRLQLVEVPQVQDREGGVDDPCPRGITQLYEAPPPSVLKRSNCRWSPPIRTSEQLHPLAPRDLRGHYCVRRLKQAAFIISATMKVSPI
jgi:hypothetical protein